jgi:CDGSH-type Zn-finger protein
MEHDKPKVKVTKNGPYKVSGTVRLAKGIMAQDEAGTPFEWKEGGILPIEETYWLCRCGNSRHKPFCDNTHRSVSFDGTETAGHQKFSELAITVEGPDLILKDAGVFCASARYCNLAGGIRFLIANSDNPESRELAIQVAHNCPSGRLIVSDKKTGEPIEPSIEPSITVAEDPGRKVSGPLFLKGGIEVVSSDDDSYEARYRVTLCRCGHSNNKPFCDGSHIRAAFNDGDESIN